MSRNYCIDKGQRVKCVQLKHGLTIGKIYTALCACDGESDQHATGECYITVTLDDGTQSAKIYTRRFQAFFIDRNLPSWF